MNPNIKPIKMKKLNLLITFLLLHAYLSLESQSYYTGPAFVVGRKPLEITIKGDIKPFESQQINIQYDYTDQKVYGGSEADFLKKKIEQKERNGIGKGERCRQDWFNSRKNKYERKFETMFNKLGFRAGMSGTNYATNSPVTLLVKNQYRSWICFRYYKKI